MIRKYSKAAQKTVEKELHLYKRGQSTSGPKRVKTKSRPQAIAIGLAKARKKGAKVPSKKDT